MEPDEVDSPHGAIEGTMGGVLVGLLMWAIAVAVWYSIYS